jgi:hypothetical protein
MRRLVQHSFWAARRFYAQPPYSTRVSLLSSTGASNATLPMAPAYLDFDEGAAVFNVTRVVLAVLMPLNSQHSTG